MWSIPNFGRYRDKMSLPEVVLHDPDYFFWASDTCAFHKRGFPEAGGLAEKARYIKFRSPMAKAGACSMTLNPVLKFSTALN
jgi:hypothetical protein